MEVKINREIRNYTESMFFGLSLRQFIFPTRVFRKLPLYPLEACKKVRCVCNGYHAERG